MLCDECLQGLERARPSYLELREGDFKGVFSVYSYRQKEVKRVIREIKYRFRVELIRRLLEREEIKMKVDVWAPIPLFWKKENYRGFNQAREIARELARKTGIKMIEGLKRVRATRTLTEMGAMERVREVKGVFKAINKEIKGKRVGLVDDVFTSGATMMEAARELKKAGAREVWGFSLGR